MGDPLWRRWVSRDAKNTMRLSVIIPAYNAADTISGQLGALAGQHWGGGWEVLVSDNGSTDQTRAVALGFRNRLPDLRVIDASARSGAGHARNVAARQARGDALLFCDADDEVAPGWLQAMGRALERHDFVASRIDADKLSAPWALGTRGCPQQEDVQAYRYPPFLPHAASCGLGVKRELHETVGGFDEDFYKLQDTDYCWRVQLQGAELQFVPDALVHMRFRNDPSGAYRQAREWGEYNVKLYKKYRPLGMPRIPVRRGVKNWLSLVRRLPREWHGAARARWLWDLNWALGRLRGSLKYRVFGL